MKFFLYIFALLYFGKCSEVDRYEKLIKEGIKEAKCYEFSNDAREYEAKNIKPICAGTFDFIIIGSGTTGSVVTSRLSENPKWNVLALEAGDFGCDFNTVPAMAVDSFFSKYNWNFDSIPQTTACLGYKDKKCTLPRGRGVGGGSLTGAAAYVRPVRDNLDSWEADGNTGWSYEEVMKYFKKLERFKCSNPEVFVERKNHGKCGLLSVTTPMPVNNLTRAFIDAHLECGHKQIDCNGDNRLGVCFSQINTKNGIRQDAGSVFIKPFLNRKNLKVLTQSFVTKIILDSNKTAIAVEYSRNNTLYIAKATKEIILSAGVYNSAQILMLSGIGPKKHLRKVGIEPIVNLPVGTNYKDHLLLPTLAFTTNSTTETGTLKEQIKEFFKGTGLLSVGMSLGGLSFLQSSLEKSDGYPDLELYIISANGSGFAGRSYVQLTDEVKKATYCDANPLQIFSIFVQLHKTKSTGTIRLKSKDPYDFPLVNPNLLSDPENCDRRSMYEGIKTVMNLINTKAFQKIGAKPTFTKLPQCKKFKFLSEKYWFCAIKYLSMTGYNAYSSNPMGPKAGVDGAVVDPQLRVHGVKNLRVADASIIPKHIVGHLSAPCFMIAEKVSDMIRKVYL